MKNIIALIAPYLAFYILGAYATTDILRLSQQQDTDVSDPKCYCPSCGHELSLLDQVPLFSFIFLGGKCRYCKAPIPKGNFLLELSVFLFMSIISTALNFSLSAFVIDILFYEIVKHVAIFRTKGHKKTLVKELLLSYLMNLFLFAILGFMFLIHSL